MNTKTNYKCPRNYYDEVNHGMGRDSPSALLDMLAEVASQTLHSEARHRETDLMLKAKGKTETAKRKNQDVHLNLTQILCMNHTQLVKHFSVFTSDELKRQYSFMCTLVPGCQQKYTSFASEGKARASITAHLTDHLDWLKSNEDSYDSFKAIAIKYTKPKAGAQTKKLKSQQLKKPQETPNKENKIVKTEKSTSYLRKILSNEMNFKEFENQKKLENQNRGKNTCAIETKKKADNIIDLKVLGDHSYYEQMKEQPTEDSISTQETQVDDSLAENIMLMVVESDSVHMKEVSYVSDEIVVQSNQECNSDYADSQTCGEETGEKTLETAAPAKPKGKAKFIGTSKEEKEMALVLIERIKKKGNPTGSNLQCRICDPPRSFTAPTTLVSHYRSHAGIKPYECRICHAVFTRRHSLKYHMLIHQNQTRFTCGDCDKKFRHPSHFREHRRRHTGESPFGCEDCGQRFKTRNTYKRHLKTRHGKVLTTTGELLCLTEEEFQKVQTNRKKKSQTAASYATTDEDAKASESMIQYQNDNFNDDSQENNNESIEDYHVQAMSAHNAVASTEYFDIQKTEIIETEVSMETYDSDDDDSNNRVIYDAITEVAEPQTEILSDHTENSNDCIDHHNDPDNEREEISMEEPYDEKSPPTDEDVAEEYIIPYDCETEIENSEISDQNVLKIEEVSTAEEQVEYCGEFQEPTTDHQNFSYQLHVIPPRSPDFDNSQIYGEVQLTDVQSEQSSETCKVLDSTSQVDRAMVNQRQKFLILTSGNVKEKHFQNIADNDVNTFIAVPQK